MSQRSALRRTVKAMRDGGTLNDSHAALVATAEGLAAQCDTDAGNASLWREYRQALAALYAVGEVAATDDEHGPSSEFLRLVGGRAKVVNAPEA